MDQQADLDAPEPGVGRAIALMTLPAALLTVLVLGYVAARAGAADGSEVRRVVPYLIAVNHTLVFAVLLWLLRREGRNLASIGWRLTPERPLGREVGVGIGAGLGMYLLKEFVFDSVRALVAGAAPTFTSVFRFQGPGEELPWLLVGTTFIVVEESVYRGYGLAPLRRRWGGAAALLVMGVLFGLLHWGNGPLAIGFTGVLGVVSGLVYLWRGTLTAPIVAHALYNALVLLT